MSKQHYWLGRRPAYIILLPSFFPSSNYMGHILQLAQEQNTRELFINSKTVVFFSEEKRLDWTNYIFSSELTDDLNLIAKKDYTFQIPTQFKMRKNNGKVRLLYDFSKKDIILSSYLVFLLNKETPFPNCLHSFLPKKSVISALTDIKSISKSSEEVPGYIIDIHHYDSHIDRETAIKQCRKYINDNEVLFLFESFINNGDYYDEGVLKSIDSGIRPGLSFSNYIENLYLLELDSIISNKAIKYSRFCDDIIFFSANEKELKNLKKLVFDYLADYNLAINKEKSNYISSSHFEYLGFSVVDGEIGISVKHFNRIKNNVKRKTNHFLKLKRVLFLSDDSAMLVAIKYYNQFIQSFRANYPFLNRIDDMREIDHMIQNSIRTIGSGKFSNAKYRIKISKLHELGYKSFVHNYFNEIVQL